MELTQHTVELSPEVDQLFAALIKFQAKQKRISKDARGHGYNYAPMEDILEAIKDNLAENGLGVSQHLVGGVGGYIQVCSLLFHESGQYMKSTTDWPIPPAPVNSRGATAMNPAQEAGTAATYACRYAIVAILRLALGQEDTDGAVPVKVVSRPWNPKTFEFIRGTHPAMADWSDEDFVINAFREKIAPPTTEKEANAFGDAMWKLFQELHMSEENDEPNE